ncbi:uncharacterized protein RSE6_13835 [Rhynchosporium secalis]|uniref:C2H2-type domain-containing protein n=1 Tax=Rhynchosporium secalis TaxID=38038 RepID=A0A1E1MTU9_RHYSE|nr:uncharacterized protein RSE6_13835 [Rhynchosporium secalis]
MRLARVETEYDINFDGEYDPISDTLPAGFAFRFTAKGELQYFDAEAGTLWPARAEDKHQDEDGVTPHGDPGWNTQSIANIASNLPSDIDMEVESASSVGLIPALKSECKLNGQVDQQEKAASDDIPDIAIPDIADADCIEEEEEPSSIQAGAHDRRNKGHTSVSSSLAPPTSPTSHVPISSDAASNNKESLPAPPAPRSSAPPSSTIAISKTLASSRPTPQTENARPAASKIIKPIYTRIGSSGKTETLCNGCSSKDNWYESLKRHVDAVHLKIKNHSCSFCSKAFAERNKKDNHEKRCPQNPDKLKKGDKGNQKKKGGIKRKGKTMIDSEDEEIKEEHVYKDDEYKDNDDSEYRRRRGRAPRRSSRYRRLSLISR